MQVFDKVASTMAPPTNLRMPAAILISDFAQIAKTDHDIETPLTGLAILVNIAIEAVAVAVFDGELGPAQFRATTTLRQHHMSKISVLRCV